MTRATVGPASKEDVEALLPLMRAAPPATWTNRASDRSVKAFLRFAAGSPRAALLVARAPGESAPAGYALAMQEPRRYWTALALRRPDVVAELVALRFRRLREIEREVERRVELEEDTAALPPFAWAPSARENARMLALFVRPEHRREGLASLLYEGIFALLRERGARRLEAYMGPDYPKLGASRLADACGFSTERCRGGGYKTVKRL